MKKYHPSPLHILPIMSNSRSSPSVASTSTHSTSQCLSQQLTTPAMSISGTWLHTSATQLTRTFQGTTVFNLVMRARLLRDPSCVVSKALPRSVILSALPQRSIPPSLPSGYWQQNTYVLSDLVANQRGRLFLYVTVDMYGFHEICVGDLSPFKPVSVVQDIRRSNSLGGGRGETNRHC